MSLYDNQYLKIVGDILMHGYFDENRTKIRTFKLPHKILTFDLEQEFPILTSKFVPFKTAVKELLWIFRDQSNDVGKLQEQNVHIWDKWVDDNNTVGSSYGFIVKKYAQMDKLLHSLKTNPQDRRMLIDIWQIPHLDDAPLYPCCFLTMWDVTNGRLNCMLIQRSGDMGLGVPFNTTQYAVLVHMVAAVTGLRVGLFTHVINNAHVYENHIDGMRVQLARRDYCYDAPVLHVKPVKNFYDFTLEDISLEGYKYHPAINLEVSV